MWHCVRQSIYRKSPGAATWSVRQWEYLSCPANRLCFEDGEKEGGLRSSSSCRVRTSASHDVQRLRAGDLADVIGLTRRGLSPAARCSPDPPGKIYFSVFQKKKCDETGESLSLGEDVWLTRRGGGCKRRTRRACVCTSALTEVWMPRLDGERRWWHTAVDRLGGHVQRAVRVFWAALGG